MVDHFVEYFFMFLAPEVDVCTQVIDSGPCTDNVVRFGYNAAAESCQEFDFGGCGGNQNNFLTLDDCNQRCVSKYLKQKTWKKIHQIKKDDDMVVFPPDI